jgi:hypothetical protein
MTRTEPTNSTTSWETKSIAALDDAHRIDSVGQDPRPRGRIRRSMTACNTCRKLKTRCDLDPRGHACRRCLSLRFVILPSLLVAWAAPYFHPFSHVSRSLGSFVVPTTVGSTCNWGMIHRDPKPCILTHQLPQNGAQSADPYIRQARLRITRNAG